MKDILIIGAGLSGATAARLFAENGDKVTVFDKRETVGGNAYDYTDKNNILIQYYGPHIFHTNDKDVFDFLSKYTEWNKYEHKVLANINGKLVPVPFNLTSLFDLYPKAEAEEIKKILTEEIGLDKKVPIMQLRKHPNEKIRAFGDFVYKNIFYTYTVKQWGFPPEELGEAVMNRVPVYISYEDRYFTDKYQYMPKLGFTKMIENLLRHKNIMLKLGNDAFTKIKIIDNKLYYNDALFNGEVIYTGCIDELFCCKYGRLPYRSLKFKFITKNAVSYQDAAVVNYTTSKKFTRISEFSKFTCLPQKKTVIVKEFSKKYLGKGDIPYYPIPKPENFEHYNLYLEEANKIKNLHLLGRLANYKYINMDIAVKNAIECYRNITKEL